jgi:hypothetical protein
MARSRVRVWQPLALRLAQPFRALRCPKRTVPELETIPPRGGHVEAHRLALESGFIGRRKETNSSVARVQLMYRVRLTRIASTRLGPRVLASRARREGDVS